MAEATNTLQNKEPLVFINESLPQLAAGEYTVKADLDVIDQKGFQQASKSFYVDAPRFVVATSDIYTVYPPKAATGRFETTLPHIVLNRRTLPWERTIDGQSSTGTRFKDARTHAPWMALLLLSEDEMKGATTADDIVIKKRKLNDIVFINATESASIPADVLTPGISPEKGPKPALTAWESTTAEYDTIDVPVSLFKAIVPQKDDLPFLAHVRNVLVDRNKESADISDEGYFSTLICNRLPVRSATKETRNTVFLVSLEGFHNYFNDPVNAVKNKNKIRLIVLTSWSFTVAAGKNFKELCAGLRVSPLKMNYGTAITNEALRTAYDYGYTLLPHQTREGTNTYSWYRGPFNPNFLPPNPETKTFASADEALRFDHKTGIFDVSYAAAWQLGRLLALKDKTFSNALYQWKTRDKKRVLRTAALQQVNVLFPSTFKPSEKTNTQSLEDLVKDFLNQQYKPASGSQQSVRPFSTDAVNITGQMDALAQSSQSETDIPAEMREWLGRLFLLHGVPLNYLIPHEHYLINREGETPSNESLCTFYIDYDWQEALLAGALNIVSADDSVALTNMLKAGELLPANLKDNKKPIETDGKHDKDQPFPEDEEVRMPKEISTHITGFLMRSELVSGWKGIKIFPKESDKKGGTKWMEYPLRIERVADDIKLCIFAGKVQEVWLIQPPEGIHFGVDQTGETVSYIKKLRSDDGTVTAKTVNLGSYSNDKGLLNLAGIAKAMYDLKKPSIENATQYSSADLAFQMLSSPVMYKLEIKDK